MRARFDSAIFPNAVPNLRLRSPANAVLSGRKKNVLLEGDQLEILPSKTMHNMSFIYTLESYLIHSEASSLRLASALLKGIP